MSGNPQMLQIACGKPIYQQGNPAYAPDFERVLEQPIAASIAIEPDVRLVITEGNYLLSATWPWPGIRELIAEDGVHPNDEGHTIMAEVVLASIQNRAPVLPDELLTPVAVEEPLWNRLWT